MLMPECAFPPFNYNYVSVTALETAQHLISLYDLHQQADRPVDLAGLIESFELRELDLPATTWGFTLDMGHKIIIAVNQTLSPAHKRFVAVHEIGHVACWHPNQLHACEQHPEKNDQLETEANTIAALLLVPQSAVAQPLGLSRTQHLAENYHVPPELILIRRGLLLATGV